jgi:hypothetical protein
MCDPVTSILIVPRDSAASSAFAGAPSTTSGLDHAMTSALRLRTAARLATSRPGSSMSCTLSTAPPESGLARRLAPFFAA